MNDAVKIARAGMASLIAVAVVIATVALIALAGLIAMAALWSAPALAQSSPLSGSYQPQATVADENDDADVPAHLRRQTVSYSGQEGAGTIVIDTPPTSTTWSAAARRSATESASAAKVLPGRA